MDKSHRIVFKFQWVYKADRKDITFKKNKNKKTSAINPLGAADLTILYYIELYCDIYKNIYHFI